ncbi:MAG: 30S ribosome-binding factor RbfA [Firmicutes bacterium]|nr:30S ribosome-binding factor RbfA [Bacillota bacterium]
MASPARIQRLQEQLKVEISDILRKEVKDPRIGFVSITGVEISGDLRHVKVFVSVMGGPEEQAQSMAGLEAATGFIRSEVGQRIRLRYTPEIVFKLDQSIERGARVMELLDHLKEEHRGG